MQPDANWTDFLNTSLSNLDQGNLRRRRVVTETLAGHSILRSGKSLVNFGGNDYLGLRAHPAVLAAAAAAIETNGVGSGASPAVTGYSTAQRSLERHLATFNKMPDALVFSSGFAGNLATLTSLADEGCTIFSDSLNHASLIDGCRLSRAAKVIYPHCNVDALRQLLALKRQSTPRALIVTESIFSMDGDAAPLVELCELAERFECGLIVDEAHATGVYGATGSGLVEELQLSHRVLAKLGTLSKAIGCLGGFVCGSEAIVEHVLNHGRSYMFSTALPSSVLVAANVALDWIHSLSERRHVLRTSAIALREQLRSQGWQVLGYDSPIIPVIMGDESRALDANHQLLASGLFVPAIRPPTVPAGTSRLRISLSSELSSEHITRLVQVLEKLSSLQG